MFRVIEDKLGPVIEKISSDSMLNALEIEKEMTKRNAEDNGKNVTVVDGKVGVSVASDTHWPRRGGGGKKYVSPSGLTYMMGCLSGMIVASHVCSQDCRVCHNFEKKKKAGKTQEGEHVRGHRCPKNFAKSKSPKTMETFSTALMVQAVFDSLADVFVEFICIDDDTAMMAHLRRKSDGGNLPDDLPRFFPIRVSDLNHRIRTVAHVIFELARAAKEKSRLTMEVAYRYKKALSYFIYGMIDGKKKLKTLFLTSLPPSNTFLETTNIVRSTAQEKRP